MTGNELPFYLVKRNRSKFYHVIFKETFIERTTKETEKTKAIKKAFEIYSESLSSGEIKSSTITKALKQKDEIKPEHVIQLMEFFKKSGFISSYTLSGSKSDIKALTYFIEFWTPSKSRFLQEQERAGKKIGTKTLKGHRGLIIKHWTEILGEKKIVRISERRYRQMYRQNF